MYDALFLAIIFGLPALVLHFLGKFFIALYLQSILGEKRTVIAAISTLACSIAAPLVYLTLRHGYDTDGGYNLAKVILCSFIPSAFDLVILAAYEELGVKASALFLTIDFVVACFVPGSIVIAMLSNH